MGHRLVEDALENQDQLELIPYNEELDSIDYIKIPRHTILNNPNDAKLGELVRNTLYKQQNFKIIKNKPWETRAFYIYIK